jgi:methionine aminopeptidase
MQVEDYEFLQNEVYALDIVLSTGDGKPKESETRTTIFKRDISKKYLLKMKASRYLFSEVDKSYPTLPFCLRYFDNPTQARMGVTEMLDHNMLYAYPVLQEKAGELVVHFKFTQLLLSSGMDRITGGSWYDASKVKSDKEPSEETKAILALSAKINKKKKKKSKKEGEKEEDA